MVNSQYTFGVSSLYQSTVAYYISCSEKVFIHFISTLCYLAFLNTCLPKLLPPSPITSSCYPDCGYLSVHVVGPGRRLSGLARHSFFLIYFPSFIFSIWPAFLHFLFDIHSKTSSLANVLISYFMPHAYTNLRAFHFTLCSLKYEEFPRYK